MRRAIAADFAGLPGASSLSPRILVTLDARLPDDPGPWTIVRIGPGDEPGRLSDLARQADFTVLIAPETSGTLASLTREFENAGARLLGSSADAVDLTADKLRLGEWLRARSIATPETRRIILRDRLPADTVYPAVLKPPDGAGSVDTFYVENAQSLPARAAGLAVALLQPYIAGTPMSASFFVGLGGQKWLIGVGVQQIRVQNGEFRYHGGTLPARCWRRSVPQIEAAIDAIEGLRGFVGVDFIWNEATGRATILEINPRPTTSFVGLSRLTPRGLLAQCWIEAVCEASPQNLGSLKGLASRVHESGHSVWFRADGGLSRYDEKTSLEDDRDDWKPERSRS